MSKLVLAAFNQQHSNNSNSFTCKYNHQAKQRIFIPKFSKTIAKHQEQYVNWRSQINCCFIVNNYIFNSEFHKIQHIAANYEGWYKLY